ncbi:MAG: DNA translocase FtsK 4TM domain-containing protein [Planctomycetota bacterium]
MAPAKRRTAPRTRSRRGGGGRGGRLRRLLAAFAGRDELIGDASAHLQEIKGFALAGAALLLLVSLATYRFPYAAGEGGAGANWGGQAGHYLAQWTFLALGWGGYFLVFLGLTWGAILVARKRVGFPTLRLFGGLAFLLSTALLLELAFGRAHPPSSRVPYGPGGYLARELVGADGAAGDRAAPLVEKLGVPGLWIVLVVGTLISFMLATEMAFVPALRALADWFSRRRAERGESAPRAILGWGGRLFVGLWDFLRGTDLEGELPGRPPRPRRRRAPAPEGAGLFGAEEDGEAGEDDAGDEEDEEDEGDAADEADEAGDEDEVEVENEDEDEESAAEVRPAARRLRRSAPLEPAVYEPPTPPAGPWKFPPIDILEPPVARTREDEVAIEEQARRLEHALGSFRVEASVVGAKVGPAVTLYELEVAQGTRMNKVTQLSQEIAAALRAKSVRIIAPIPGKATIGIEVPNEARRIVRLSELISQRAYDKKFMSLPLFLGIDAEGAAIVEDLTRMPHLLIAGTTGSGKSVCINAILASLLLTRSPHDIQLILIDPKMVELQMFANVPHLMLPVVSDMRQATNVLLWAVEKMEGRYQLFKDTGVRNIKAFNALGEEGLRERLGEEFHEQRTPRHMPYIVIVIDEMADLMMMSKKEAELTITRLAQKSRAVGIHVIVATQRPSTDVITGVLKGNLPTRIAFQVASKVDSRVILDHMGAEKLLGQGDMLYTPPQSSQIRRVQGAYVADHEIQALVEFVTRESAPSFSQELVQTAAGTAPPGLEGGGAGEDDLWDEAVRVILKSKRGSASLLQRALGIGYTRASRLIDLMTAEGIVGEHKGSKAREVLWSLEEWEEANGTPMEHGARDE